jgi:hypothetical protein
LQGEWQTFPNDFIPVQTMQSVVEWYSAAFNKTKLLTRYSFEPAYRAGFGLSDGSFAEKTVGGDENDGNDYSFYFLTQVESANQTDFWRTAPMGGESPPEIAAIVFEPDYPAGTFERQDFMVCVNQTHASYMYVDCSASLLHCFDLC